MTIQPVIPDPLRAEGAKRMVDRGDGKGANARPVNEVARGDRVELSAEGRERARAEGAERPVPTDSVDRLERVRTRVADGSYHTPEVAEAVAERLLDSGELDF